MRPRAKGVIGVEPTEPTGALYLEAQRILKAKAEKAAARRAARDSQPVPNWIAYKDIVFKVGKNVDETGRWLGGKLPPCKVCGGILPPREHHVCPGFTPKYVEHDEEWHERWEQRRQEIREARLEDMRESRNSHYCDDCGEELLSEEHAIEHAEDCRRTVECPDCGEELEYLVEHECSVRECQRCGESMNSGTEHTCEP